MIARSAAFALVVAGCGRPPAAQRVVAARPVGSSNSAVPSSPTTATSLGAVAPGSIAYLVLGPTEPFAPREVDALTRYMARDRPLFVALEADNPKTPRVSSSPQPSPELASLLGLRFDGRLLASSVHVRYKYHPSDRTLLVVNGFANHPTVATLSRNQPRAAIVLFGTGSLEPAPESNLPIEFVAHTTTASFRDTNGDYERQPAGEPESRFNVAAAISYSDSNRAGTRAFVLADSDALSDLVMGEVVANQILFVDAMKWLLKTP